MTRSWTALLAATLIFIGSWPATASACPAHDSDSPTAVKAESYQRDAMPTRMADKMAAAKPSDKEAKLRAAMDKLWEDHITWTRLFIVSAAADLPDKQATTERLLQNQTDIGNAIKPYFGAAAGTQLTGLLKDHILIAADVVTAAKADDKAKLDDANKRWFANADAIAAFLGTANPQYWPEATVKSMMHEHLKLTTDEAVAQLTGDYKASIAAYDKVHTQILHMSAALSDGIVGKFPDKF
jgi:hypothetical protein